MSIGYDLHLDIGSSIAEIEETLQVLPRFVQRQQSIIGPGVICDVAAEDARSAALLLKVFGVQPRVHIAMQIDKQKIEQGMNSSLLVAAYFLRATDADLILILNGDCIVFLRRDASLLVNRSVMEPLDMTLKAYLPEEWEPHTFAPW